MSKLIEQLTQRVVTKPIKYLILCAIFIFISMVGLAVNTPKSYLIMLSIGLLTYHILLDIIQYFIKKGKR